MNTAIRVGHWNAGGESGLLQALQKIWFVGNSAVITIPRPLLFKTGLMVGDLVHVWEDGEGKLHLEKFQKDEWVGKKSPGVLMPTPAEAAE